MNPDKAQKHAEAVEVAIQEYLADRYKGEIIHVLRDRFGFNARQCETILGAARAEIRKRSDSSEHLLRADVFILLDRIRRPDLSVLSREELTAVRNALEKLKPA